MSNKDIARVLAILRANYPYAKFDDPEATIKAWEMCLGEYSSESVFNAVKLHMKTSKFFPTPADIIEKMQRADLIYSPAAQPKAIEAWTSDNIQELISSLGFPD